MIDNSLTKIANQQLAQLAGPATPDYQINC